MMCLATRSALLRRWGKTTMLPSFIAQAPTTSLQLNGFATSSRPPSSHRYRQYKASEDRRIIAIKKCGDWKKAVALANEIGVQQGVTSLAAYNAAMGVCAQRRQHAAARALFDQMKESGLKPTLVSYSQVMSAFARTGRWKDAFELLSVLEDIDGLKPNVYILSNLITACQNGGKWGKSLEVFYSMQERWGVEPNTISFNAAINACAKGAQVDKALELFHSMKVSDHGGDGGGVKPDIVSFNSIISACGKQNRWEKALEIFHSIEEYDGVEPDVIIFNATLMACEKGGLSVKALELLQMMEERGLRPDVISYNAAISACDKAGDWETALELLATMTEKRENGGVRPNIISLNAIISACGKGGQIDESMKLLRLMEDEYGIPPDIISFNAAISACDKNGQWEEALELLNEMSKQGVRPNVFSFSAAISACGKGGEWEEAVKLLDSMEQRGVTPNAFCVGAAIRACEKGGQWEKALALLHAPEASWGVEFTLVNANSAISACGKAGKPDKALEAFLSIQDRGLRPDVVSFNACIEALHTGSCFDQAVDLLNEARRAGFHARVWSSDVQIDLHECPGAIAETVLRGVLLELRQGKQQPRDISVITGRGNRSGEKGAVLPSQVRLFLTKSYGMEVVEVPHNSGCFILPAEEMSRWIARSKAPPGLEK